MCEPVELQVGRQTKDAMIYDVYTLSIDSELSGEASHTGDDNGDCIKYDCWYSDQGYLLQNSDLFLKDENQAQQNVADVDCYSENLP